ncbi:hypothetical protein VTN49DRAFT_7067 [Thermomyces lanuginosus]|uniref:uncharacterized protein n=1 Tax=Thermomyces lanuginosus TaxID=5541 RepID=UPI0037430CC2
MYQSQKHCIALLGVNRRRSNAQTAPRPTHQSIISSIRQGISQQHAHSFFFLFALPVPTPEMTDSDRQTEKHVYQN